MLSSRGQAFVGSVLGSSYPPVPLLLSAFSTAGCWIITKCWLVIKSCACLFPAADSIFEVKAASCVKIQKMCVSRKILCSSKFISLNCHVVFTFLAACASEPTKTFTTKTFSSISSLTSAIVKAGTAGAGILFKNTMEYVLPLLVCL